MEVTQIGFVLDQLPCVSPGAAERLQFFQLSIRETFVFGKVGEKLNDYSVF